MIICNDSPGDTRSIFRGKGLFAAGLPTEVLGQRFSIETNMRETRSKTLIDHHRF